MPKIVKSTKLVYPDFIDFFNASTECFVIKERLYHADYKVHIMGYDIYLIETELDLSLIHI